MKIKCPVETQNRIREFEKRIQRMLDDEINDIAADITANSGFDITEDEDATFDAMQEVENHLWNRIKHIAECPYMPI